MSPAKIAFLLIPFAVVACAEQPQYAVRPGDPRAEMPKPTYATRAPGESDAAPANAPPPPMPTTAPAPRPTSEDGPSYYKPEPITGAPPPPDEAGPSLRGHQSPGPIMPVRSTPPPALETPREVVVRPGESIFEVAERVRTPIRAIIDLNGLQPPYDVTPGSTLKIPPPVVYTVKAGDTFLSLSRRFSIDPRSLANLNDLTLESPLKAGQRLALPSLVKDKAALPPTTVATAPVRPVTPGALPSKPVRPASTAQASSAASLSEPDPPPVNAVAAGKGKFAWPIKGDILSAYGPKGPGQRNDGVNIAAKEGDIVRAAAAGAVVYAGNSVPGFGNLVVVKHPGGWTSLYGNLGKMSVKIGSPVGQGDQVGVAGTSGSVDRPQVHFEVRYAATPQEKARPVDPQALLP
jgi:murein DD-endopeptidase MepM/ murein hydrolase activator NlpD